MLFGRRFSGIRNKNLQGAARGRCMKWLLLKGIVLEVTGGGELSTFQSVDRTLSDSGDC